MEDIYKKLSKFDRMVIWCTYPELTLEEVEIIEEMIVQNYSAEEIFEYMELEDRSDIMQEVIETLCQINEEEWKQYFIERIIQTIEPEFYDRYLGLRSTAMYIISQGCGIPSSKREREGKTKTWKIFETMESAKEIKV